MGLVVSVPALVSALLPSPPQRELVFAGVEGGGQSWRVAIAKGSPTNIVERASFETTSPAETLGAIRKWLDERKFDALGVATFGPIEPLKSSDKYGYITSTPKPHWGYANVLGVVYDGKVPCKFDTDVNAPALAEFTFGGKSKGHSSCAYVTVGTGIGVGLIVNGQSVHGLLHPEAGHMFIPKVRGDTFPGNCPFHEDRCVEGLTATGAVAKRLGIDQKDLKSLPSDHAVWDHTVHALACLCVNLITTVSPDCIVLSGGVMQNKALFPRIRAQTLELLNGYIQRDAITQKIDTYIVPSVWDNDAGIIGALTLSKVAYDEARK